LKSALLVACLALLGTAQAQNVNVTATAGTPAATYATLNAAFAAINAGTHQGTITCTVVASTTEPAPPTPLLASGGSSNYTSILINCTGNVAVNSAAAPTASRGVIEIQGDNVTIDGDDPGTSGSRNLSFAAAAVTTTGVAVVRFASPSAADGAINNTIKNCIVIGSRNSTTSTVVNYGIYAGVNGTGATLATGTGDNLDNLTVENNEVRRCFWGIYVSGTAGNKADNLVIRNNLVGSTVAADAVVNRGIYIQNTQTASGAASAIVEGNDVSIRADAGGTGNDIANIEVANGNAGARIRRNKIHDGLQASTGGQGCYGIFVTGATDNTNIEISNNFIWDLNNDNWSTAISATSADIPIGIKVSVAVTGLKIWHNSISLNKANNDPATAGYSACLQLHSTGSTGSDIRNNIFSNTQVAQPTSVHVCVLVPSGFPFGVINNNVYYDNQTYTHVGWNGAIRSTLGDWQGQTLQDAASTAADPTFTSSTDLHIAGTPAALNNAGASVGVATDIDNDYRSSPPDIGADEFTTNPCGPIVASVNYVQDCVNSQFFLDVTVTALNGSSTVNVGSDFAGNPGVDNNVGLGTYQIGPFPSNTNVQVVITSNTSALCNTTIGTYNFNCATNGQNALNFDGVNDGVLIPNSASVNVTGTQLTLEAWIYPTAFRTSSFQGSIINKEGSAAGYMLRCGGNGILSFAIGNGSFPEVTSPAGTLTLNTWQHVAAVYDGATIRIFKDGVQVGSANQTAAIVSSATVGVRIGNWVVGDDRGFVGQIDEVRIWNVARTLSQLNSNLGRVLCGNETGLQAYYQFNQGTAAGNNAAVTTLTDLTANANTGNLQNMTLSGPASNWVVGRTGLNACANCEQASATAVVAQDCANNQFFINVTVSALNGNTSVDVLSNYGGNPGGQTGVGVGSYQLGPFPSLTSVVVNVNPTGAPDCNLAFSPLTYDCTFFGQNALHFDGTNDRVDCGTSPSVSITGTNITLEAWIYPTAWQPSSFQGSIINKEGPNQGYMLRCGNNGQLSFALGNGTTVPEVQSATGVLTLNTWQHVAGTYDGTTLRIYRNGVQVGSSTQTFSLVNSTNQLTIGDYAVTPGSRVFIGRIDEARIWNVTRSAAELAADQNNQLCPGTGGLQAYYRFDEGVESANNAGVTTLPDVSGNGNNGTLVNFALNGPTSNWVTGKTGLTICAPCTGTPTAGTIAGTAATCAASSNVLTVTGATVGLGITYQWKYRANGSSDPFTNLGTTTSQNTNGLPIGVWEVVFDVTCSDGPSTTSSLPFVVTVNQVPTATAGSNSPVCAGTSLNLTGATDIGTSFAWTGPASFASTDQNATRASMISAWAGTYTFTATANGCTSAPSTVSVAVNPSPVINSTTATPNPVCDGNDAQLQVSTVPPGYLIGTGGATYVDISGTGTAVTGIVGDDVEGNITIPGGFLFNGVTYTNARVGSNGAMALGSTTLDITNGNVAFPSTANTAGNVILAPFWDDLDNLSTSNVYTQQIGNLFIIQWHQWGHFSATTEGEIITFQVQLDLTTGVVYFVYQDVLFGGAQAANDAGASATVGIQWAASAGNFAQYSLNTASLINGQVISFTPGSFNYLWSPNTFLSADNIANPVAESPNATTAYSVLVTGSNGCTSTGNVTLTVNQVPNVALALVDDCPNSQFSISVNVNATGNGPTVNLSYTVNGGAPIVVSGLGVGPQTPLGPFAQLDEVVVSIVDPVGGCNSTLPLFRSDCPEIVTCGTTLVKNYCYGNNDTRSWVFTTSNGIDPVRIDFVSGSMAAGDVIRAYDGTDNTGTPLLGLTGNFLDLAGAFELSSGPSLYLEVESDGSGSCADAAASTWVFNVRCNPPCQDPNAFVTPIPNCVDLSFTLDVDVYDLGSGIDPTNEVDIEYTVNGGQPDTIPGVSFGITTLGPFTLGDQVNVRLLHEYDAACNKNLGTFTAPYSLCPNNEPCDARPLTMNPNYTCTSTTPGEMAGSTLTAGITGGCTGVNQDVWFRFVATGVTHRITLGGTTTGLSYSLYTAASCTDPLTLHPGFGCIAAATVTDFNGLTSGNTYYVRVSRTTAGTNVFTMCVSAPPASFVGENALDFAGVATGGNDRVTCGTAPSIDITGNAITLEAWIYPTAWRTESWRGSIINKEAPATAGYMIRCGNNGQLSFNIGTGTSWVERVSATGALTLNTWQHVAGVFDGTTLRIYRDGVELTPVTSSGVVGPIASTGAAQQLSIGNWSQGTDRGFVGKIDEARVWNVALSPAQLMANMNQELCGGEPGLRAYYQFNDGVDGGNNAGLTTLIDLSGFGNNGTLANFALNGPTSNWVQGKTGMTDCPPCASAPTAGTINGTTTICSDQTHSLNLLGATTGTGITYQWYYGPAGSPTTNLLGTGLLQSTASIPAGTWELVVDVTCAGFGTVTTAPFTFVKDQAPTAVASAGPACLGQNLQLTGTTDIGTSFTWTGPNTFNSTSQNPVISAITAAAGGTYTFTATANGCSVSGTVAVTVNTTPVITAVTANPNPVCINGNSQLNATAPVAGYVGGTGGASFIDISGTGSVIAGVGDDTEHNLTTPAITFNGVSYTSARLGNNGVIVLGSTAGDVSFSNVALPSTTGAGSIYVAPWWDDLDYVTGTSNIYTQTVGNRYIVQWNNASHNGAFGAANIITFQVQFDLVTGVIYYVYQDVVIGNATIDGGASATVGIQWAASAGNFVQYSFNTASLTNGLVISYTPNQASFAWTPNTYLTADNIANPVAQNVAGDITYSVTATAASGCVSAPAQLVLEANPALTPGQAEIVPATPSFCTGSNVTLTANPLGGGGPYTYAWTDPSSNPAGTAATQVVNVPGTWSVTITDNCGGSASASIVVTEYPVPVVTVGSNSPVCVGGDILLSASSNVPGSTFAWTGPNGFTSTDEDPVITGGTLTMSGTYTVVASANGCSSTPTTTSVSVNVTPTTPVVVPTVWSLCPGGSVNIAASSTALSTITYNGGAVAIPAAPNSGGTGAASLGGPYPSTVTVSGLPTSGVTVKRVLLNGVAHTFPDDIDILLQSPTGTNVVLMSDAGLSNDLTGQNFEIRDDAAGPMSDSGVIPSGAYRCTNYVTPDPWFTPGPGSVTQATPSLSLFTGNLNGTWSLFVADDAGGDVGSMASWAIELEYNNVTYTWTGAGLNTTTGPNVTATPLATTTYTVTAENNGCSASEDVIVYIGTNELTLEVETDANAAQTSWEIIQQGSNDVIFAGGGLPSNATVTQFSCLPDGCYRLRVLDAGGDGIAGGGYILRTNAGDRIIDNRDNFTNGSVSAVIGNGGFCLPLGTDKLIYTSCDKLDWVNNQFIVAAENPAVSAQWQVGNQTDDGYQFWWFDPNGSYGYTKFRSHATSDGFGPANAIRACHARINNWSPNQVPANVLMNVKVRSRVNGNNSAWGPVCRFKIDPVTAACPLTKLMDIPGNQFYSCGVTRTWGGNNRVHARPVDGATQYQFRFNNGELAAPVIRTVTTYYLNLNWTPALPNGTYQVQVRAFKNGAWCVTSLPWGDECNVTIVGSTAMTQNGDGTVSTGDAKLAMFPNPNRGDLLTLSLSAVEEGVNTVSVDIFDLTGAVVSSRTIAVNDGMVYQVLELNEMASGLYMVNITAGTQRYTERLVISR
jgi:hypothetical protein